MKRSGSRGVTLLELLVVVAVSGVLMGIAGFSVHGLRERYEVESQIRQMQRDMVSARGLAFERNKVYFVTVTNSGYQIIEDTNDSEGTKPDFADRAIWPVPKQFARHSQWNGTVIMGANGIMSKSTGPLMDNDALDIRFDADGIKSECDCISVRPTRIREGRWNGVNCEE